MNKQSGDIESLQLVTDDSIMLAKGADIEPPDL
jgi:hypothetical protein